jgi:hypothetical protein
LTYFGDIGLGGSGRGVVLMGAIDVGILFVNGCCFEKKCETVYNNEDEEEGDVEAAFGT